MTHKPFLKPHRYEYNDCWIDRYETNNGVVLQWAPNGKGDHRSEVLVFIAGDDLGTSQKDSDETVLARAVPIFKAILFTHNRALEMGQKQGSDLKLTQIKNALEL